MKAIKFETFGRRGIISKRTLRSYLELWKGSINNMILYYRAIIWYSRLLPFPMIPNTINVPTLLLFGVNDTAVHIKNPQVTFDEFITDPQVKAQSKLKFVEDCSHWITHEKSDLVNDEILQFITL